VIESLQHYGTTQPLPVLVAELNKLYHEHEALGYDDTHPEIFEQLPPLWEAMIEQFYGLRRGTELDGGSERQDHLRILDLGCGTGFEARQCLMAFGAHRVDRMVCYDPSPAMLGECRRALEPWHQQVEFVTDLSHLTAREGEFDLLITNSVLHHMVDPVRTIRQVAPWLSPRAVWLSGHEPSRRFFQNPGCSAVVRSYSVQHHWLRLLSLRNCTRRLLRYARMLELPQDYAAKRAMHLAMFERRPPAWLVDKLVDFHVITSERELEQPKGLDFAELQEAFDGEWELVWRRTYSFLGPHYIGRLPAGWRREAQRLEAEYPDDGANCCLVWQRMGTSRGVG
jgi:SAM-dependent methyltransferase